MVAADEGGDDGPRPFVDPGQERIRRSKEKEPEGDRSRQRQDPEQAHHLDKATGASRVAGPAGGTARSRRRYRDPARRHRTGPVGRSPGAAAILRPSSTQRGDAREPGGQRSREQGASAVP